MEKTIDFLRWCKIYGIDLICYSSNNYKLDMGMLGMNSPVVMDNWRMEYDNQVIKRLANYTTDLNVLAGYMLVVSNKMCEELDLINLNPAAPGGPSGTSQEVIWKLIDLRADKTGVMMIHLVTNKLDEGPPVTYCTFPIKGPLYDKYWKELDGRLAMRSITQIMKEVGESNGLFMEIRRQGFKREQPLLIKTVEAIAESKNNSL